MGNERITENIVRKRMEDSGEGVVVEEQMSADPTVAKALKAASKQGSGAGRPEFIVRFDDEPDTVILIECKASVKDHISPRLKRGEESKPADIRKYSVDGVLHYGRALAKVRNVICVAVSGQSANALKVAVYTFTRGSQTSALLLDRAQMPVDRLLTPAEYLELMRHDPRVVQKSVDELLALSREIHNFLRDYGKVTEAEKPLVISAILLALSHNPFRASWSVTSDADLPSSLFAAVDSAVGKAIPDSRRRELMMAAYTFLKTHPELTKPTKIKLKGRSEVKASPLRYLIQDMEDHVLPFVEAYTYVDVIGAFYAEFLRYTGGDGKGLGIVLTPRHLTELFVAVAEISVSDTVLDSCAGTGGFLIAAMKELDRLVGDDKAARQRVRESQLIGIEQQPAMYALCVSNMILRGDGRSNLYRGSCFDAKLQAQIRKGTTTVNQPNKGLLNPPYSQKGEEQEELDFVRAMLDMLAPGGTGVVVVPMSCAIAPSPSRERLLAEHTLVATMSLPDELFYPVGAIPIAMVFKAHQPHKDSKTPTWFGYWKDDGFVKIKNLGRVDADGRWPAIRDKWLDDYYAKREVAGRCVKRHVGADDEWCAEAYMETNYSTLTRKHFEDVVREHALFVLANEEGEVDAADVDANG